MAFAFYGLALWAGVLIYGGIGPAANGTGMGGAIAAGMVLTFLYFLSFVLAIPASIWLGRWERQRADQAGLAPEAGYTTFVWALLPGVVAYLLIILALDQLLPGTLNPGLFFVVHSFIFVAIGWTIFNRPLPAPVSSEGSSRRLSLGQVVVLSLAGLGLVFNWFQFYQPKLLNFPGGFPNVPVHKFTRLVMPADDQSGQGEYMTQTIGSYQEVVDFYEQSLSSNGWSIKAQWDYPWPTKIIASDGKRTLRLTIYGSRVDFQVDPTPCHQVTDSERCL